MNLPPTLFHRAEFDTRVWELVHQIPRGYVLTYGEIASQLAPPLGVPADVYQVHGPRWVGQSMAGCPAEVPWQRVINGEGKISERRGGGALLQRQLLEAEGIEFDTRNRIDLKRYRWTKEPGWVQKTFW